jgi:hypothetical protein
VANQEPLLLPGEACAGLVARSSDIDDDGGSQVENGVQHGNGKGTLPEIPGAHQCKG